MVQKLVPGVNMLPPCWRCCRHAGQRDLRQPRRDGDADQRAGAVHVRLGRAHVGALLDQLAGQADRQIERQLQPGQIEMFRHFLAREAAGQFGQQIALLRQLLLQRRQRLVRLRQRRFLRRDIAAGDLPEVELASQDSSRRSLP